MNRVILFVAMSMAASAEARSIRLQWMHSGAPATALRVQTNASRESLRVDAGGGVVIPAEAKTIRIVDPHSALTLLDATIVADAATLRVPEPVRVSGTISGARGAITVRAGDGLRDRALLRFQRAVGALIEERPAYAAVDVPLLPSPMRWNTAVVTGRRFVTRWMLADPPPQLVAFDASGASAIRQIAVPPGLRPRTTIDAGTIALAAPSTLDVHVALPPGDVATNLELLVTGGEIVDRDASSLALSALDQIDRRAFALLALSDVWHLERDGRARLLLPPWLTSVRVAVRESFGRGMIERDVPLPPGGVARFHVRYDELGSTVAPRTVAGVVTLENSDRPAAGATVVLSDGALRRETRSDAAGRFRFENVTTVPPLTFFVDARNSGSATHRLTTSFQEPEEGTVSLVLPQSVPIPPEPVPLPASQETSPAPDDVVLEWKSLANCGVGDSDDQYPVVALTSAPANPTLTWSADWTTGKLTIIADKAGTYAFHIYPTPFLFYSANVAVAQNQINKGVTVDMVGEPFIAVSLTVLVGQVGELANGVLLFAPPADVAAYLDATEVDLDRDAKATIPCMNNAAAALYIAGQCDGDITLKQSCTIFVPQTEAKPCTCK